MKQQTKQTIAFCLLPIIGFFILFSCNPAKKVILEDNKAIERVKAKRSLIDSVKMAVLDLYPCSNDTTTVFKKGKTDTVKIKELIPVIVSDPETRKKVTDSLTELHSKDCDKAILLSYDAGYNNAKIDFGKLKIPVKNPDTLASTVIDRQLEKALRQQIEEEKRKNAYSEGVIKQLNETISAKDKKANKDFWWLIAAISFGVISNAAWLFFKIKTPTKWF